MTSVFKNVFVEEVVGKSTVLYNPPLLDDHFYAAVLSKHIAREVRVPLVVRPGSFPPQVISGQHTGAFIPILIPFEMRHKAQFVEAQEPAFIVYKKEVLGIREIPASIFTFFPGLPSPMQVLAPMTLGFHAGPYAFRVNDIDEIKAQVLAQDGPICTFVATIALNGVTLNYFGGYRQTFLGEIQRFILINADVNPPILLPEVLTYKSAYRKTLLLRAFYFGLADLIEPWIPPQDPIFCLNGDIKDTIVTPPSGTRFKKNMPFTITAEALPGRELTSFIVKGVEYVGLEHSEAFYSRPAFINPPVLTPEGGLTFDTVDADRVQFIKPTPTKITITIDPGEEDFCVLAHSSDRIIEIPPGPAGSFITVVLATDECYPGKTWEVLDDAGFVAMQLDDSPGLSQNTLSFFIPEDMEPGTYEIKIRLNGKTQVIDYILRIVVGPLVITYEWELIQEFDLGIRDLIRTSDYSAIYFCTDTSIYKTNIKMDFIEKMPLSGGSVTTAFMGLAEASEGRIVAVDDVNVWVLNIATGEFEKTAMAKVSSGSFAGKGITADPGSGYICLHDAVSSGQKGAVSIYNLDALAEARVTLQVTDLGLNGWVNRKGVYAGEDKFIFVSYSNGATVPTASIDCAAKTVVYGHRFSSSVSGKNITVGRLPSGDLGAVYHNGVNSLLAVSQDEGATFTDTHILNAIAQPAFGYQFKQINANDYLFTGDNILYYTDDAFVTTGVLLNYGSPRDTQSSRITFTNGGGLVWGNRRGLFMSVPNEVNKYKVTFTITETDTTPVTDAVITLNGVANAAGDYEFPDLMPGLEFEYVITRTDFVTVTDTFQQPKEDEAITVVMEAV